jgi:dihydrofolate reductase
MRKVVVYELMSLDGVAEDPDQFISDWDEAMDANLAEVIASQDAVILGRTSYEEWAAFWPTSDVEPFATFINGVDKYVATTRPFEPQWANSTVIDAPLADFVRDLKNGTGGDIGVHASISVANYLLRRRLVDELRVVVAPRIVGLDQMRLFESTWSVELEPIRSTLSPTGYQLADYRVVR